MNLFVGTGRLLRDVELRTLPNSDTMIGKSAIAMDRPYKKGKDKESDIVNITIFGKTAEFAATYSGKGKMVEIVGRLQMGSYTNKEGSKVYTTDIVVSEFKPLEWAKREEGTTPKKSGYDDMTPIDDSDVPF